MGWSPGETLSFPVLQKKKGNKLFFYPKIYLRWGEFFLKFWSQVIVRTEISRNPLIVQSRYQHGQRTWAESSSLHHSVLRWLIQSYFEGNILLFLTMPGRKVYVVGVGMTKVSDEISFMCKSGPIWSYVKCYDPAAMMSQLAIKWTRLNPI